MVVVTLQMFLCLAMYYLIRIFPFNSGFITNLLLFNHSYKVLQNA